MPVMVNTAWHYVTVGLTCLTLMLHVCSVYTLSNNTCFSPQRRRMYCDVYIINTFKDFKVFLMNLQPCFCLAGETFPVSLAVFPIWPRTHWQSPLFVSLTGVFRLWLTSQSRRLWGTTWWMHSNANTTARDATVVFFLLSLSLSCARLISAIFFSVSLRLSLHACFSAALVYLWKKQKRRKCLAFYLFFCFVYCFCQVFCFHASHLPWSHSLTLPLSLTPLFSPLSHVTDIMIVLPRLMIILQCEGHRS